MIHESLEGRYFCIKPPLLAVSPGKNLLIFYLEISRDRPGILAEVTRELSSRGMNIIRNSTQVEGGKGLIMIIVERPDDVNIEELKKHLESIEGIGSVEYEESRIKGLLIPYHLFPLMREDVRIIAFNVRAIKHLSEELSRILGSSASGAILFRIGYEMGKGFAEGHLKIAERVGIKDPFEILRHISVPLYASSGYGIASLEEAGGVFSLRIRENFEAVDRKSKEPSCYMTKGMWKGGLESIFNRPISIEEVKCKAKGDEYCEFKIEIPRG